MQLRRALVIDNDDSAFDGKKLSRVKVKILPELKDVKTSNLPWVEPFENGKNGVSSDTASQNIPEVDSYIRVLILDQYWKQIRYLSGNYIEGLATYQKWEQDISSSITDIDSQTYPQPVFFEIYKDGSAVFRNTSSGETGCYHAKGTYSIFDKDGNIINYTKDKDFKAYNDKGEISLSSTGEIKIDSTSSNFTIQNNTCKIEGDSSKVLINNHLEVSV